MRKVHYQVMLDVFTNEDDDVSNGTEILREAYFWPEIDGVNYGMNVLDVMIESIKITDSR